MKRWLRNSLGVLVAGSVVIAVALRGCTLDSPVHIEVVSGPAPESAQGADSESRAVAPPAQIQPVIESLQRDEILAPDASADSDDSTRTPIRIRVLDGSGDPLANIRVSAGSMDRWDRREGRLISPKGLTDSAGVCSLEVLSGTFCLTANVRDERDWNYPSGFVEGIVADGTPIEYVFSLERYECAIDAFVRDDLGAPVPGVTVRGQHGREGVTDANGLVRLGPLPKGTIGASLQESDFGYEKDYSCVNARWIGTVDPSSIGRAEFTLLRNGAIEVAPLEDSGKPIGARVSFDPIDPSQRFASSIRRTLPAGETGRIEMVPPTRYRLHVDFDSDVAVFAPADREIVVAPGETTRIELLATPSARVLEGVVIDYLGNPRAKVDVTVMSMAPRANGSSLIMKHALTDVAGRFTIRGLPDGILRIRPSAHRSPGARVAHFGTFEAPWLDVTDTSGLLTLRLEPGCVIRGSIEWPRAGDRDVSSVAIDRYSARNSTRTNLERRETEGGETRYEFVFDHLRPGTYRLCAGDDFKEPRGPIVEVTVSPDSLATSDVTVVLQVDPKKE